MNTKKTIVVAWAPPSQHDSARRAIALHLSHGVQRRLTSELPNLPVQALRLPRLRRTLQTLMASLRWFARLRRSSAPSTWRFMRQSA
ncbi:hypothetical protein Q3O85_23630 [Ralstonia pseudosolanacearum]|nr:hypothetical protein [Ralstonia pseudosolanacearum]MDO3559404.1 hypothetical protein [Ralstonia pseudosolanacearum]MDO3608518.1 hypothetical protein [Ralstonia pseudosolanacearum]MDO3613936.1 hypothetical protein [Ralstonia pseudosolanacearum]